MIVTADFWVCKCWCKIILL